ncbi:MAG: ABC transporter permease [Paracoccaceae bacterium]|nr:ABC transporter permease [Paracoccaceae bacterium]
MTERPSQPALEVRGLNVFYGASHALQGVDLTLPSGVLSVVGRNGMGKTTLCKTVMGLLPAASGSVAIYGAPVPQGDAGAVARSGVGYVPQGRRLWRSLSVHEHLVMLEKPGGSWSAERVYDVFPRLAERRGNGGGQLSGGEQQMLAIARALLQNPRMLVMDEPTEGLAPVIVDQVAELLITLAAQREMDILVIEQNIRVACAVSEQVAIMLNGRINRLIDSTRLAADTGLQQALLGVGRHEDDTEEEAAPTEAGPTHKGPDFIFTVNPEQPRRWSRDLSETAIRRKARAVTAAAPPALPKAAALIRPNPVRGNRGLVIVAGTMDTKAQELRFVRDILRRHGLTVRLADLSLRPSVSGADIPSHEFATLDFNTHRPLGDRVAQMAEAFAAYVANRSDIAGMISVGGSGGSAIAAPALRALPLGVPKMLVTTMASGDVSAYVGGSDLIVMPAVADLAGLNRITGQILANAAHGFAGMVLARGEDGHGQIDRAAVGLTMFGITTPCVTALTHALEDHHECIVFHATGSGGRALEALVAEGQLQAVYDITTTEIADHIAGGTLSAGPTRLDVFSRIGLPYIGAAGALDTVNFGAPDTLPDWARARTLYQHNPQVTLMRTNAEEARKIGAFIAEKLNKMAGPAVFLLPEGGLSALDTPGGPFEDKAANAALFETIERETKQSRTRRVIRLPYHINAPEFTKALLRETREIAPKAAQGTTAERRLAHG